MQSVIRLVDEIPETINVKEEMNLLTPVNCRLLKIYCNKDSNLLERFYLTEETGYRSVKKEYVIVEDEYEVINEYKYLGSFKKRYNKKYVYDCHLFVLESD